MERQNRYDGLHPAAVSSIRYHAGRLARGNAVRDMDVKDYEQQLALQLLLRSGRYDPQRASFATFVDRVMRSQSATLASPTEARSHERQMVSLQDPVPCSVNEDELTFEDLISETEGARDAADLHVDLSRFIDNLPPTLRRCMAWIAAGGAQAAIRDGLHRSSFYEARERLQAQAVAFGLAEYL